MLRWLRTSVQPRSAIEMRGKTLRLILCWRCKRVLTLSTVLHDTTEQVSRALADLWGLWLRRVVRRTMSRSTTHFEFASKLIDTFLVANSG